MRLLSLRRPWRPRARWASSLSSSWLACCSCLCFTFSCAAPGKRAVTAYVGAYSNNALSEDILTLQDIQFENARMGAVAYSEVFDEFLNDHGRWEWELQGAKHWGDQDNEELNALILVRWRQFPWNEVLRTSVAVGDGLSWASEIPALERAFHDEGESTQLLNYLLFEWTFGLPDVPEWDLALRIHHRSGIFGLFDGVTGGSNVLGLGLRYGF